MGRGSRREDCGSGGGTSVLSNGVSSRARYGAHIADVGDPRALAADERCGGVVPPGRPEARNSASGARWPPASRARQPGRRSRKRRASSVSAPRPPWRAVASRRARRRRRRRGHRIPPPIGARRAETHTPREAPCSSRGPPAASVDLSQARARTTRGARSRCYPTTGGHPEQPRQGTRGARAPITTPTPPRKSRRRRTQGRRRASWPEGRACAVRGCPWTSAPTKLVLAAGFVSRANHLCEMPKRGSKIEDLAPIG